jgi:hypothetical protein
MQHQHAVRARKACAGCGTRSLRTAVRPHSQAMSRSPPTPPHTHTATNPPVWHVHAAVLAAGHQVPKHHGVTQAHERVGGRRVLPPPNLLQPRRDHLGTVCGLTVCSSNDNNAAGVRWCEPTTAALARTHTPNNPRRPPELPSRGPNLYLTLRLHARCR